MKLQLSLVFKVYQLDLCPPVHLGLCASKELVYLKQYLNALKIAVVYVIALQILFAQVPTPIDCATMILLGSVQWGRFVIVCWVVHVLI